MEFVIAHQLVVQALVLGIGLETLHLLRSLLWRHGLGLGEERFLLGGFLHPFRRRALFDLVHAGLAGGGFLRAFQPARAEHGQRQAAKRRSRGGAAAREPRRGAGPENALDARREPAAIDSRCPHWYARSGAAN